MSAIEDIYNFALPQLEEHGFEDTPENRLAILEGMRDTMEEVPASPEELLGKSLYMFAITNEILLLKCKIRLNL